MRSGNAGWRRDFAPYASEFIGTFFLACTIALTRAQNQSMAPLAVGFVLAAMHYSSGSVSGGHFNPAVTIGVWLSGREVVSAPKAGQYVVAQVFGAASAAAVCRCLLQALFVPAPTEGFTREEAAVAEVVYSGAWVFVVMSTTTLARSTKELHHEDFAGLAIGLTVTAAAFAGGGLSGCCLNPALAMAFFGIVGDTAGNSLLYIGCPLLGALVAAALFRGVRSQEYSAEVQEDERERQKDEALISGGACSGYGSFSA